MHRALLFFSLVVSGASSAAPPSDLAQVHVSVRDTAGGRPKDVYMALVPPHRPWRSPAAETVAKNGVATLKVPVGSYVLIAGAPGYDLVETSIRTVADKEQVPVTLPREATVTGTVSDAAGNPIEGARVMQARSTILPEVGQLSALAIRHLASRWTTTTDEAGAWVLPASSTRSVPFLIEAPGYAPAWHVHQPSGPAPVDVTLRRGGSLRLRLDRADAEFTVVPVYLGEGPDGGVPEDWRIEVWVRRAANGIVQWDSLPAGSYEIMARPADPLRFMQARRIATAVIAENGHAEVDASLPALPPAATAVTTLFVSRLPLHDLHGTEVTARLEDLPRTVPRTIEQAAGGALIHANVSGAPELAAVSRERIVTPAAPIGDAEVVTAIVHDRADARMTVRPSPETLPLPGGGTAEFHQCREAERVLIPVTVGGDGTIRFAAPAGCAGAVMRLRGFEPVVLPRSLARGRTHDLGEHVITASASVVVRVVREPAREPAERAVVTAYVQSRDDGAHRVEVETGSVTPDGTLRLAGLPAGEDLLIEAFDASLALTATTKVVLTPGEERRLDDLAIPQPASLIVEPRLSETFKAETPGASIVSVAITRSDDRSRKRDQPIREGAADFGSIEPGQWTVVAFVAAVGTIQPITVETVDIAAGDQKRISPVIEPLLFRGRLTNGGRGIAASIAFSSAPGPQTIRRVTQSQADGTFSIVLPARGRYDVQVRMPAGGRASALGAVELVDPSQAVDLVLPAGRLSVHVRRTDESVADALVTITQDTTGAGGTLDKIIDGGRTSADGTVHFERLARGSWLVQARTAAGEVAEKLVNVGDSEGAVELQLDSPSRLEGVVIGPAGPAAGAEVNCVYAASSGPAQVGRTTAGADGRFVLKIAGTPPPVVYCSGTSREGAVGAFTLSPGKVAELRLPSAHGSLVLSDWGTRVRRDSDWLVAPDGRSINLSAVAGQVARGSWAPLSIPALPAGRWRLVQVRTSHDLLMLARGIGTSLPALMEVDVRPGSSAERSIEGSTQSP